MCQQSKNTHAVSLVSAAVTALAGQGDSDASTRSSTGRAPAVPAGTRRRRLWELDHHAHCPVVGVCFPIAALRRILGKVQDDSAGSDAYEMHIHAVAQCRQRNPVSEAFQSHLDLRYQLLVRQTTKLKSTEALATWWIETSTGRDLPGALWATLTHPRCTPALEYGLLGQVHMLQHQVGMATRVELERFEMLIDENAVLARELAGAQERSTRQAAAFGRRVDGLEADLLKQRALLVQRQTELAQQRELLAALEAASPQLRQRHALAQEAADLRTQVLALQRQLAAAREALDGVRNRALAAAEAVAAKQPVLSPEATKPEPPTPGSHHSLADRAVLCVGGRPASVPLYRLVVERTGGRFLHHDGGDEDSAARLDATLAAADLVICQTGCVSHNAYWRVKDHCKRTGKRYVFVETPSRAALERALADAGRMTFSNPAESP